MPFKEIQDPMYETIIHFAYREKPEAIYKYCARHPKNEQTLENIKKDEGTVDGYVMQFGYAHVMLVICQEIAKAHTLAHEAFHITAYVMRQKNIKLCEESEEAFAYHLAWVFDELVRFVKEVEGKIEDKIYKDIPHYDAIKKWGFL